MSSVAEARADRLLRWYPRPWRDRYGEEFAELLIAEIEEQPQSWRRTSDVARGGIVARLSLTGLGGGPVTEPTTALATSGCLMVGFAALGTSLWSQLATTTPGTTTARPAGIGLAVLTVTLGYLILLAAIATAGLTLPLGRALCGVDRARFIRPMTAGLASLVVLVAGGLHVAAAWPTSGRTGPVPSALARFGRAETISINTYWAHPSLLTLLHPARLAWMLASPIALAVLLVAATSVVRRLELSARVLRHEARVAKAAIVGMMPMLAAAGWWVLTSQHATGQHAGTLDLAMITAMAALAATAARLPRFAEPDEECAKTLG